MYTTSYMNEFESLLEEVDYEIESGRWYSLTEDENLYENSMEALV